VEQATMMTMKYKCVFCCHFNPGSWGRLCEPGYESVNIIT